CVPIPLYGEGGHGVAGRVFDWEENDIFVVPNFLWRRHFNKASKDAVLYTMQDRPLLQKIGQWRVQGRRKDGSIELRLRAQRGSLHEQRIGGAGAVDSGEVVQFRCVSVRAARTGTG
ncbi:MAG: hypothetical protein J0I48_22510, partial [Devosia sp.]|nr:hypothetical protein [Devosia sp.]